MSEIENLKIDGGSTYTVGNQDIIANEWEASKTYVKDKSYVIREHRLYVCNVTHTSVEPFDPDNWTEITVGEAIAANTTAIGDLSTLTTTVKSSIVGAVNEVVSTKQDKIKVKSFTATTDGAGNVLIPDLTVADNVIVSCMSSNGYATGAIPSGNSYYFKVLSNNSPVTPVASTTTNCYVMYY